MRFSIFLCGLLFLITSCSSVPRTEKKFTAEELTQMACEPGQKIQSTKGNVWFKTKSKEISGQYSANVLATFPDHLKLEVTNFLGGTEALITVEGNRYLISGPDGQEKEEGKVRDQGEGDWGGIPLRWANDLFLGRIPCPQDGEGVQASVGEGGDLFLVTRGVQQSYHYKFRRVGEKAWPETLHWEMRSPRAAAVDFRFDDPEDGTGSPKKWEAESARGAIKVRWRERLVTTNASI